MDDVGDGAFIEGVTPARISDVLQGGMGITIPPSLTDEKSPEYIERKGTGLNESMAYLRMLLGQLGVFSGVPDYVFGVQLDRPASQTERVLFAGQARVNRFRRDIEVAFGLLGWDVQFTNEPFTTRTERVNALVSQFKEGIIDKNEVRKSMGYETQPRRSLLNSLLGRG